MMERQHVVMRRLTYGQIGSEMMIQVLDWQHDQKKGKCKVRGLYSCASSASLDEQKDLAWKYRI
jgi:hypothetical protein